MAVSVWEAIFMLLVLKIPVVYLGAVVWWAIRAEPSTGAADEGSEGVFVPLVPCGWDEWRRRRRSHRPRGGRPLGPLPRPGRVARAASGAGA